MLDNGPSTEMPFFPQRSWLCKMTSDFTHDTKLKSFPLPPLPFLLPTNTEHCPCVGGTGKDFIPKLQDTHSLEASKGSSRGSCNSSWAWRAGVLTVFRKYHRRRVEAGFREDQVGPREPSGIAHCPGET